MIDDHETALTRDIEMSREALIERLPEALGGREFVADGETFIVNPGENRRVQILLTQKRDSGSARTYVQVDFMFENMSDEEARLFMQGFDALELDRDSERDQSA